MASVTSATFGGFYGAPWEPAPWEPMRIQTRIDGFGDEVAKVAFPGMGRPRKQRGARGLSPLSLPVATLPPSLPELELLPKGILDDLFLADSESLREVAEPPLPMASHLMRQGTPEVVEAPVAAGATPALGCRVPDLVRAAGRGDLAEVVRLLDAGEDPSGEDDFQLTALHGAAKKGHAQIVALLLRQGAKVNAVAAALHGETPLHYAAKYGHAEVVQMLLEGGADAVAATQDGRTPFQYACDKGHARVKAILSGADH